MKEKEYFVSELEKNARLVWFLDDDPEPDLRIFVKDGKAGVFISLTSGIMGLTTRRCISLGEPFSYDEANVLAFDPSSLCKQPNQTCILALGQKGRSTVYAFEGYQVKPIIENAPSMQEALQQFGERIGLHYAPWMDLLVPPPPTWERMDFTPDSITSLEQYQVFVFGSNREGQHIGGAARYAYEHFGAIWGQGEGLQGQSYALPTMGLSIKEIKSHIERFAHFANEHPELEFLVTRVGCGIAGFKDRDIAPLFLDAYRESNNITLPESFADIISCILRDEDY